MATSNRLSIADRQFLSSLTNATLANPFSEGDPLIAALGSHGSAVKSRAPEHFLKTIQPALDQHLGRMESSGRGELQVYKDEDREQLEFAYLLQAYLRYVEEMDELIQRQHEAGEKPVAVPFARKILAQLERRGFASDEAVHYLALFFQMRRAYLFISRGLVGDSVSMQHLRMTLWDNIFSNDLPMYHRALRDRMEDFSTLLLGETGTGKGEAAAAMGRAGPIVFDPISGRFAESFTAIFVTANLSQFSESLIESELFGHRKGAFTGAVDNHIGLLSQCSARGTLFLDEIGDLSPPIQVKLLQVLQDRTFRPVGSHIQERFSGRVIGATNHSLEQLRSEGRFRDDFYYRLCSDVITVPPLRQRIAESAEEMPQLVSQMVLRMTGKRNSRIATIILETLARDLPDDYPWPGNVRELEQAARRIVLTGHYHGDIRNTTDALEEDVLRQMRAGQLDLKQLPIRYCQMLYQQLGTYEGVAKRTRLDRRTVKKYLDMAADNVGTS